MAAQEVLKKMVLATYVFCSGERPTPMLQSWRVSLLTGMLKWSPHGKLSLNVARGARAAAKQVGVVILVKVLIQVLWY